MRLWEYSGKHVKILTDDGQIFEGIARDYTSELDNPGGVACISIGNIEFEETEIINIEVVQTNITAMASAI